MHGLWGAPGYRVPTGRWHGKRGASQGQFDHDAKLEHLTQPSMHSFTGGGHLGIIPSKRAFSERFESSREVVVHGSLSSWRCNKTRMVKCSEVPGLPRLGAGPWRPLEARSTHSGVMQAHEVAARRENRGCSGAVELGGAGDGGAWHDAGLRQASERLAGGGTSRVTRISLIPAEIEDWRQEFRRGTRWNSRSGELLLVAGRTETGGLGTTGTRRGREVRSGGEAQGLMHDGGTGTSLVAGDADPGQFGSGRRGSRPT